MKVVAVVSAKGGVGKTTVCANLCVALQQAGHAVFALDLDPQNALRYHLAGKFDTAEGVATAGLHGGDWRGIWRPSPSGVYLLGYGAVGEEERERFEQTLRASPRWLRSHLEAMRLPEDTVIIVDTPPGPSIYLRQALAAADQALVVTLADAGSYATLPQMESLIHAYGADHGEPLSHHYVVNQVDQSRQLSRDVLQILQAGLGERLVGRIHHDQAVAEALGSGTTVLDYDGASQSALDIRGCARAVGRLLGREPLTTMDDLIHDQA